MIESLLDWHASPTRGDPLETASWGLLRLQVDGIKVSRLLDKDVRSERDGVFLPAFALVQWIVSNWWTILYETSPLRGSTVSFPVQATASRDWRSRHCLRAGTVGYAAPNLVICGYGDDDVAVTMRPDPPGSYPHTRVQFLESVTHVGPRQEVIESLAKLVSTILGRLWDSEDSRVEQCRKNWEAITSATSEERSFCESAGRMGLDPYDTDAWSADVLEWLERQSQADLTRPFLTDLLESSAQPETKIRQSSQVGTLLVKESVQPGAARAFTKRSERAYLDGYTAASIVRKAIGLKDLDGLDDLRAAATELVGKSLHAVEADGALYGSLVGIAGWKSGEQPVVITRRGLDDPSRRFNVARGLYLAFAESARGPRLVTDARTWPQRASRAFAAELLAPREGVAAKHAELAASLGAEEATNAVAHHYRVRERVVAHQLDNLQVEGV